jgi:hypothetical protein
VCPRAILSILEKTKSLAYASIQTLLRPGHSLVASPARLSLFCFSSKYINSEIHTTLTVHMFLQLNKKHVIQCRDPEIQSTIHTHFTTSLHCQSGVNLTFLITFNNETRSETNIDVPRDLTTSKTCAISSTDKKIMTVVTITALCNPPHPLFKQNDYQHFYYCSYVFCVFSDFYTLP